MEIKTVSSICCSPSVVKLYNWRINLKAFAVYFPNAHPMSHYFKYHKFVWYFYKTISLQETPQLQRFRVKIVHLKFHKVSVHRKDRNHRNSQLHKSPATTEHYYGVYTVKYYYIVIISVSYSTQPFLRTSWKPHPHTLRVLSDSRLSWYVFFCIWTSSMRGKRISSA